MWSMASSREGTTRTASFRSRNSCAQSSSDAAATRSAPSTARVRSSPTSATPSSRAATRRQERVGHGLVHEHRLGGVADRGPLRLAVDHDVGRHGEVGRRVHVDVAVAVAVDHVRHRGVVEDRPDQRRPAPRDQAVDGVALAHELDGRLAGRVLDQDQRRPRAGPPWRAPRAARPAMAMFDSDGARRPPEEGDVARLEAQPERVAGHVGPVLVDDGDHAERDAHLGDAQAVRARPPLRHLAHRVGEPATWRSPPAMPSTRASDRRSRSTTVGDAPAACSRSTSRGVGGQQLVGPLHQQVGGGERGRRPWPRSRRWPAARLAALARVPRSAMADMAPIVRADPVASGSRSRPASCPRGNGRSRRRLSQARR